MMSMIHTRVHQDCVEIQILDCTMICPKNYVLLHVLHMFRYLFYSGVMKKNNDITLFVSVFQFLIQATSRNSFKLCVLLNSYKMCFISF